MELIGKTLKKERLKKKIRLQKISKDLNISHEFLLDIENNNFPDYINRVFLIGHIRSYAQLLNLDDNLIIENFKIQTSFINDKELYELQKPTNIFNLSVFSKSISLFSIILIASSFYFLFINPNSSKTEYAMTPNIPENLESVIEATEMQLSLKKKSSLDNMILIDKYNSNSSGSLPAGLFKKPNYQQDKLFSSSSVVASLPSINDKEQFKEIITLKFLNPTWLQLKDKNDKIIISRLMDKNNEYSYSLSDNFFLTAGNAGNIIVLIDGVVKGKAGRAGEVIESLIIDSSFNN